MEAVLSPITLLARLLLSWKWRGIAARDDGDMVGVILVIRPCGDQEVILLIEEDNDGGGH